MIVIRRMRPEDIVFALKLTNMENWGYIRKDFERILYYEPRGCFVAFKDGKGYGLVTTISYGKLGWIGNVVVHSGQRGGGIGKMLVMHALGYLKSSGINTIKLASYLDTQEFYLKLGFEREGYCQVYAQSPKASEPEVSTEIRKMKRDDLRQVITFDRKIFGFDRARLLIRTFKDFPHLCFFTDGPQEGYIMGCDSAGMGEIGPWICSSRLKMNNAESLLLASLKASKAIGNNVIVPEENRHANSIAKRLEMTPEFRIAIMRFGEHADYAKRDGVFGLGSLAQG